MADSNQESLLSRLAGKLTGKESGEHWAKIPTTQPQHPPANRAAPPPARAEGRPPQAAPPKPAPRPAAAEPAASTSAPAPAGTPGPRRRASDQLPAAQGAGAALPASAAPAGVVSAGTGVGGEQVDELIRRLSTLAAEGLVRETPAPTVIVAPKGSEFYPHEPETLYETGLSDSQLEALIAKFLLARGDVSGRDCVDQIKLPFKLVDECLRQMKTDQLVVYVNTAQVGDYVYRLTDLGRERARRYSQVCSYFGSAPVKLADYIQSIKAQTLTNKKPTPRDLAKAFADLLVNRQLLDKIGPAINSGRGLFLFGAAGNGKTSIAERITRAYGDYIWIPRAIGVDGETIRLFDPVNHELAPQEFGDGLLDQSKLDKRWIRIVRPTIVVGGELTMDNLEVTPNPATGICEAPLQLKSNCGTLVIDDFGRQKMRTDELLNRWIVPLEKRYDYLNLPNGKKVQVPFDQLIVFSTNLQPRDLVDEAFLRRIPYKIEVKDPTEEEFRELMRIMAKKLEIEYRQDAVDYLIDTHYHGVKRNFRCCQPRDLLTQIRNYCVYQGLAVHMSREMFDFAVESYFSVM